MLLADACRGMRCSTVLDPTDNTPTPCVGVIFGLVVIDNTQLGGDQRSIFGLFSVPAALYPWVLLVLWQVRGAVHAHGANREPGPAN